MSTPKQTILKVKDNQEVGEDTHHLVLEGDIPPFKPGQFLFLTCEQNSKKRAYSIASSPGEDLALCIKGVGEASKCFVGLKIGTNVQAHLPMGHFTIPEEGPIVMLASGTGLVPYRSMLRTLFERHYFNNGEDTERKITLIQGAKHKEGLIYEEEFRELAAAKKNFTYVPTLSQEEREGYGHGRVQKHLDKHMDEKSHYLICGLTQMVEDVERLLSEKGIRKEHIHYEKYG